MSTQDNEYNIFQSSLEKYISPAGILLLLALFIMLGMFLGGGASYLLGKYFGYPLTEAMDTLGPDSEVEQRNFIRFALMLNHLILFVFPPIILALIFFKKKWYLFLNWRTLKFESFIVNVLAGTVLLLVSLPLVQYLFYWNKQLPLPEWAKTIEDNTSSTIQNLLVSNSSWELLFNLLVIAVIPAIGEEMVFRGVIQRKLEEWIGNPVYAIWIAAIIFSGFHVQLEGFFPRLLLGALLGYLFYWSKSLWLPIIIHFLNNGLQILVMYFYAKDISNIDLKNTDQVPIWGALVSIVLILSISHFLITFNASKKKALLKH